VSNARLPGSDGVRKELLRDTDALVLEATEPRDDVPGGRPHSSRLQSCPLCQTGPDERNGGSGSRLPASTGSWIPPPELTDDQPLLSDVLDSLDIVGLVLWIESDLGIELVAATSRAENFATVARIAGLIDLRR